MSELSGKGYRNVRRDKGRKKMGEPNVADPTAALSPTTLVGLGSREHLGYNGENDGLERLTAWARQRVLDGRKLAAERRRSDRADALLRSVRPNVRA